MFTPAAPDEGTDDGGTGIKENLPDYVEVPDEEASTICSISHLPTKNKKRGTKGTVPDPHMDVSGTVAPLLKSVLVIDRI